MNESKRSLISPGVIVQLDPERSTNPMFGGCLMVVTETKDWGVQGYVQSLGTDGMRGGQAYYRAKWDTFEPVEGNKPVWIIE